VTKATSTTAWYIGNIYVYIIFIRMHVFLLLMIAIFSIRVLVYLIYISPRNKRNTNHCKTLSEYFYIFIIIYTERRSLMNKR